MPEQPKVIEVDLDAREPFARVTKTVGGRLRAILFRLIVTLELPGTHKFRFDVLWGATCFPFLGSGCGMDWHAVWRYWMQIRKFKRNGWPE